MRERRIFGITRVQSMFSGIFGLGRTAAIAALLVGIVLVLAVYWFIQLAPPQTITLAGGPQGAFSRPMRNSMQRSWRGTA